MWQQRQLWEEGDGLANHENVQEEETWKQKYQTTNLLTGEQSLRVVTRLFWYPASELVVTWAHCRLPFSGQGLPCKLIAQQRRHHCPQVVPKRKQSPAQGRLAWPASQFPYLFSRGAASIKELPASRALTRDRLTFLLHGITCMNQSSISLAE